MEVEEAEKSKREPEIENFSQPDEEIERQSLKTVGQAARDTRHWRKSAPTTYKCDMTYNIQV